MRARVLVPSVAAAIALAVAGCGSDDGGSTGTGTAAKATPSSAAASAPAGTKTVSGSDYRTAVPEGWRDITAKMGGTAIKVDRVYGGSGDGAFAPNLVIIRETPEGIAGAAMDEIGEQVREQTATALGADVPDAEDPTTLGGEEAERWTLRREAGGQSLAQRQLVAKHDDALYTLTLTSPADDGDAEGVFDDAVSAWSWK